MPTHVAYLGLGSNLGDRAMHLRSAVDGLASLPSTRVVALSDFLETEPVGPVPQGPFLNAAAALETALAPRELLAHIHAIERERGRERGAEQRWGPRTLDIDILLYDDLVIDEPGLTIPHPRMHERLFALEPLASIAPHAIVPPTERTVSALLQALRAASRGEPA
jgi:2-amino-4-hydroxy-6-hydroxymethyldihydropteridine diphosphokinase